MSWHDGIPEELNRLLESINDLHNELNSGNVIASLKQAQEVVDVCRNYENTLED